MTPLHRRSACILAGSLSAFVPALSENPNIIMILVDDLGYADLSCQGVARDIQTPNIDQLLNGGIRFTNFHANCPVSSPSRAALLTGRYPDMVGVPGVIRTHEEDSWGYLSPNAVLLPQMLKKAGYHSAIIGKWHLGLTSENSPNARGFDYFHGFLGDMMDDYTTHLRFGQNYMRKNDRVITPKGHATELFTDWAIDYVTQRRDLNDPFFLYLAYNAPHTPIQPPQKYVDRVVKRTPAVEPKRARLIALIEHLDENIGRLIETLKANNQLENTLIVFASDNGGQADADANNLPFRGAKQNMYEGGIRVPAGVYWKNHIKSTVNNNFVMLSDLFPTFCELADVEVDHPIDGMSILPLLKGEPQITDERTVFWVRREGNMQYGGRAYYAARRGDYKILQNSPWEPMRLFNVTTDSTEQNPMDGKGDPEYTSLFKALMEHVRKSGSVPWQPWK